MPIPARLSASTSSATTSSNKRPIQELSEEEQLQAAIRASMMPENDENDSMDDEVEIIDKPMEDDNHDNESAVEDSKPAALNTFEQEILTMDVGDEPAGKDAARIQIRMPDGKRLVRKFRGEDCVKVIYAFVAVSLCIFLHF